MTAYYFWKHPINPDGRELSSGLGVSVIPGLGQWVLLHGSVREIPPDAIHADEVARFLDARGRK